MNLYFLYIHYNNTSLEKGKYLSIIITTNNTHPIHYFLKYLSRSKASDGYAGAFKTAS